ncbi:MAG: hypothetical protein Q9174_002114 [Haloplaca sp. 1 TL-2023]
METAMGESQHYEILSIEELEELKRELTLLSSRIDATKRKLVLENKIRDATQSFTRLDSPGSRDSVRDGFGRSPKGHRRSILGSRGSISDMLNRGEDDLTTSTKKCEALAQELWNLEKRTQELQRRLLEHTAGVLQVTHTGFLKNETPPQSPDAFAHFALDRSGSTRNDTFYDFDDRSFYRTLDSLLDLDEGPNGVGAKPSGELAAKGHKLKDLNTRLHHIAQTTQAPGQSEKIRPPDSGEEDFDQQLSYMESTLDSVQYNADMLLKECQHLSSKSGFHEESAHKYETSLKGLWEGLRSNNNRSIQGDSHRDSSSSDDSGPSSGFNEPFTLEGLSSRVQAIQRKNGNLREQKDILTRQVQQQRELNGKSDAQKDSQISELTTEVAQLQDAFEAKQKEAKENRDELVLVTQHLDTARQEATLQEQQREMTARNALDAERQARRRAEEQLVADLQAKQNEVHRLEAELADSRDDHGIARAAMRAELEESEKRVRRSVAQVEAAREDKARFDALELSLTQQIEAKTREADKAHEEIKGLEDEMVRLSTELTMAKAELDGAYGTRAERAAEMAANPAMHKELEETNERNAALLREISGLKSQHDILQTDNQESSQRIETLQRELSETIGEFETMTKASIEFEKDREALEASLDKLRDRCEELENQLGEEKLRHMGVRSPMAAENKDSTIPGATSANVLKTEFRKMMREMRAENTRVLRMEQEERRKLEAIIRSFKKEQTPGKSSLNQSITAS